jgi:hypothetical protein
VQATAAGGGAREARCDRPGPMGMARKARCKRPEQVGDAQEAMAARGGREQVIELLKAAFALDRLTKDELDGRAGSLC